VGEGFWGGWREAVVTDVMPRSYAMVESVEGGGKGGGGGNGGEERVWTKSVVSEIPQTQDVVMEQETVKTPARTVGGIVPKETGGGSGVGVRGMMITTAMPGLEITSGSATPDTDAEVADEAAVGHEEAETTDTLTTTKTEYQEITETKILTERVVVTKTLITTELAVVTGTGVRSDERRGVVREDL
jgi:hypothetical protein